MKVFRVERPNQPELHFYTVRSLRRYLSAHPEISEVSREWWVRNDLIEDSVIPRDEVFNRKSASLRAGQTIQWAVDHGTAEYVPQADLEEMGIERGKNFDTAAEENEFYDLR